MKNGHIVCAGYPLPSFAFNRMIAWAAGAWNGDAGDFFSSDHGEDGWRAAIQVGLPWERDIMLALGVLGFL